MPILTQTALVLAKVETTPGEDAAPSASTNAILVMEPDFSVESEEITRNFSKKDLSNFASRYGRRRAQVTFSVEVRGGGTDGIAPDWAVLLEGCAMAKTVTAAGSAKTIAAAPTGAVRASNVTTFTTSTAHGLTVGQSVTVAAVTDSTFNGTFTVLSVPTNTTFTVANAGTDGTSGTGTATATAVTSYSPISDSMSTLTLYVWFDGIRHVVTGAMGTWSLSAEAGQIATIEFTFTGNYATPTQVAFPSATYNNTIPPIVENAGLTWNGSSSGLIVGAFSADIGNEIALRPDVNSSQGLHSIYISGRNPTGGFTPEVTGALSDSFWADWEAATTRAFLASVGSSQGNKVVFSAPATQLTNLPYSDRDNLRAYDVSMAFRRASDTGNDELKISFE